MTNGYHFVLIVDTDEVVVPLKHSSWQAMLEDIVPSIRAEPSAISIRNAFKFSTKGEARGSLLDYPKRSAKVQDKEQYGKSFIR